MMRREFILGGTAAAWPLVVRAQQNNRIRRIAVLQTLDENDPNAQRRVTVFVDRLRQLGWGEGAVMINIRWGGGDTERTRQYAMELIHMQPDVIYCAGSIALLPLKRATHTIPIVFTGLFDPVGGGFVASMERPGGNITGFTLGEYSMGGKMLEVLREVAPKVKRIEVLLSLDQPPNVAMWRVIEATAPSVGVRATATDVQAGPAEIERAIEAFAKEPDRGLIVLPGSITIVHRELIVALAARYHLPAVYGFRFYVTGGGLVSYGTNIDEQSQQGADYVDRILRGEKPADLPVQQPTKFELVINLKTANVLGLTIPQSILATAEVIE